jgi:hypothetical protein
MDRILSIPRLAARRTGLFAAILHRLAEGFRQRAETRHLDSLPRERMEDLGLAPRTVANHRHSGEAGPIPRAPLW